VIEIGNYTGDVSIPGSTDTVL